jgi:hypothetical protein
MAAAVPGDGGGAWFTVEPLKHIDYRNRKEREWWWGGIVSQGTAQPYGSVGAGMSWEIDLKLTMYNQNNPILVSNKGRYLWIEKPRKVFCRQTLIRGQQQQQQ